MQAITILFAAAALGIEVGWEPIPEGGHEYTIQLEPKLLPFLQQGNDVLSDVPPNLNVRRYRVTIGTGKLARIDGEQPLQSRFEPPESPSRSEFGHLAAPPTENHDATTSEPAGEDALPGASKPASAANREMPGRLPPSPQQPERLDAQQAKFETGSTDHNAEKPKLTSPLDASGADEPSRPWWAFLTATLLLCCSLGANVYLGWIAWDARAKHRSVLAKLRAAATV